LCSPTLGRAAPGEGQPVAAQYQGGLRTASEESCLPQGRAALWEAQYQGGLRMATEKLCMLSPRHAGGGQPDAAQFQGRLWTASEELCLPPGCAALSPTVWRRSRLPGTSREMDELCMPEAAVLCQAGLMVASESCLPPGHAVGGQPEAAQYQGGLRTASEESCLPPGCVALGHAAWRRSQLPSKKKGRRRRTREGQPEAATRGQAGLRMASEKLCMLPPGCAGGDQPEAAQYQGGLRAAWEESFLPPGGAAFSPTVWRRSRLPGPSKGMDDRKFFIHNMTQMAFLKAKEEFNNNVRTPLDELCTSEAAVLCQAGLIVALESCLPLGRAALGETQYQGRLRMAAEKECMLSPRHVGGGQPEAAQYQGGLRTASEE
jgi:hypothetical protein